MKNSTMELEYFLCKTVKRLLFISCRFPAFKYEYIRKKIDKPTTCKGELECYMSSCTQAGRKRALFLIAVYITYCLKNLYIPYSSFVMFDYDAPESNVKLYLQRAGTTTTSDRFTNINDTDYEHATSLKSFACLWTNCSRFSAVDFELNSQHYHRNHLEYSSQSSSSSTLSSSLAMLARDAALLPIFSLCKPAFEIFYTPIVKLEAFGILVHAASFYNIFLLGSFTTIQQMLLPADNEMIMFICAPKITAELARIRTSELFFDLIASFHNFRFKPVWQSKRNHSIRRLQAHQLRQNHLARRPPMAELSSSSRCSSSSATGSQADTKQHAGNDRGERSQLPSPLFPQQQRPIHITQSDEANLGNRALLSSIHSLQSSRVSIDNADTSRQWGLGPNSALSVLERHHLSFEGKSREDVDEIIGHCMPLVKVEWWRPYFARMFLCTIICAMSLIGLVGLACLHFIDERILRKRQQLQMFSSEIERQNCAIWRSDLTTANEQSTWHLGDTQVHGLDYHHHHLGEIIHLDQIDFSWSYIACPLFVVNLIPGFSVAILFAYYWTHLWQLNMCLAEVRMFMVATLVVAKFRMMSYANNGKLMVGASGGEQVASTWTWDTVWNRNHERGSTSSSLHPNEINKLAEVGRKFQDNHQQHPRHPFYEIKLLRERFQQEVCFVQVGFLNKIPIDVSQGKYKYLPSNSLSVDQQHFRHFARELFQYNKHINECKNHHPGSWQNKITQENQDYKDGAEHEEDEERNDLTTTELEMMEQIYIHFRLLIEHIQNCSPSIQLVLAITYLLNYGLVAIAVICSRKMSNLNWEPIVFIIFGWSISNYLILLGANFHANAKKLQPLLWSIIAQLTHSDKLRVQHMRHLWTKQVQTMDDSGGLALSALGVRVTYVNIIQLAVGTATIVVISIRPS